MRCPRLTRRLRLQERQRLADGAGGYSESWQVLGTLWAELVAGNGKEQDSEAGAKARVAYRITLRAAPIGNPRRPKPGQRFAEAGRVFHIEAVADRDAAGRYLTCFGIEEVLV